MTIAFEDLLLVEQAKTFQVHFVTRKSHGKTTAVLFHIFFLSWLVYLHKGISDQRIIHGNMKPENILLDSEFSAKVGDFGMSCFMNRKKARTMIINVRGTRGYVAPEWLSNRQITITSDVYSYGTVFLENVGKQHNLKNSNLLGVEPDPKRCYPTWAFSELHYNGDQQTVLEVLDPIFTGIANPSEVPVFGGLTDNVLSRQDYK